jgi:hypothetical protein
VGSLGDVIQILRANLLVLALHAMACVAGFMAGSSLPLQAEHHTGWVRFVHERGQPAAMGFVVCATGFSLSLQAYTIGQRGSWRADEANGSDCWRRRSSRSLWPCPR